MQRSTDSNEEMLVKVGRSGGEVKEYAVKDRATLLDVLEVAGLVLTQGERVRVNGESASEDDIVEDGDIVIVSGKVAGA